MLDSIYHMCSNDFVITFVVKTLRFCHIRDVVVTLPKYFLMHGVISLIETTSYDKRGYHSNKCSIYLCL